MMTYEVTVVFRDDTTAIYHCEEYGHTAADNWLVLENNGEPHVLLSKDNVKSVMINIPELLN